MGTTAPQKPRNVVILGSTGSIGTQALQIIAQHPNQFKVIGLAAGGSNLELLTEQVIAFEPDVVAVARPVAAQLQQALTAVGYPKNIQIDHGQPAVADLATIPCDVVLNGVDGAVGLSATLATLTSGNTLALANKESLIMGGELVLAAAGGPEAVLHRIIPVDSEHSALAQCLTAGHRNEVRKLILTASGGPFRGRNRADLADITPAQALQHPTWSMGQVVTLNSATMMNKSLEIIEAHLLFGVPYDQIDVTVHPQSVVHSMVEFCDGSTMAQCSPPDMRIPIALGLTGQDRLGQIAPACDWTQSATWTFHPTDEETFPATRIAREVGELGGTFPAVFNAANEAILPAFLAGSIPFLAIVDTVAKVVQAHLGHESARQRGATDLSLDVIQAADQWARLTAEQLIHS